MPFLGQDWRSPGEQWVKTFDGWERLMLWRLKLLENLNENVLARWVKLTDGDKSIYHNSEKRTSQPHVFIRRSSKEHKVEISVAEGFSRLDMQGAVKDIRRFNYVIKLVQLIVRYKLSSISGTTQRQLFSIMEEALQQAVKTNKNLHIIRDLLQDVQRALIEGHYNHVGSSSLWSKHQEALTRMQNTLNDFELKEREDDGGMKFTDLPSDCIREILHRFTDGNDLVNTGLTNERTFNLTEEKGVWKDLCLFHFDNQQIQTVMHQKDVDLSQLDANAWKQLYTKLSKRYGKKDFYAEMLHLCRHCGALFWHLHGHPCLVPDLPPKSIPIPPVMVMELFSAY